MTWQNQKLILLLVAITLMALLAFTIGISVGSSYEKDTLIEVLFPALSVLGNWVAGIGAIAAVFTSLWLADNQRKLNSEDLDVRFNLVVSPPDMASRLMVSAVSNGNRSSNVRSLSILSSDSQVAMWVTELDPQSDQLPQVLPYGHASNYLLVEGMESHINNYVNEQCDGSYKGLKIQLSTTLGSFSVPFSNEIIEHLQSVGAN